MLICAGCGRVDCSEHEFENHLAGAHKGTFILTPQRGGGVNR